MERRGLHKEKEATAARKGKENMSKSKESWRGRTRRTRVGKREEKERNEKRTKRWNTDWDIWVSNAPGLEHPGKRRPWTGATGLQKEEEAAAARSGKENMNKSKERWSGKGGHQEQESGRGRSRRRRRSRQAHGNQTGTSGEETLTEWNIRGAEALDWNIRGRSGPGLERPGLQKKEEATEARNGMENMNNGSHK